MFRNNSWRGIELKIVVVAVGVLGFALQIAFATRRERQMQALCQTNLKMLGLAMGQYLRDYDEKYPPAAKWADVLPPYTRDSKIFSCSKMPGGYALNRNLDGLRLVFDGEPQQTPMIFDSSLQVPNAYDAGESWPVPTRHRKEGRPGNNLVFADGHIAWREQRPAMPPILQLKGVTWRQAIQAFKRAGVQVTVLNNGQLNLTNGAHALTVNTIDSPDGHTVACAVVNLGLTLDQFRRLLAATSGQSTSSMTGHSAAPGVE